MSFEDAARSIVGGVSGFFGWDTPNDRASIPESIAGTAPATSAAAQPQMVPPVGNGGGDSDMGIPNWVMVAGAVLAVGVVVALVAK